MSAFVSGLINQLPVLAGGFVAALAGLIGVICNHRLQASAKRGKELRVKLEELVRACFEIDEWCKQHEEYCRDNAPRPSVLSPVAKIRSIALLHFPEIDQKLLEDLKHRVNDYANTCLLEIYWHTSQNQEAPNGAINNMYEKLEKVGEAQENLVSMAGKLMDKYRT